MNTNINADIGVFGGTGFYSLLENVEEVAMNTPYGKPSDKITLASVHGKKVAFLPRHGKNHSFPPHKIPYKANLYAMKELGVKSIIGPTSSGSLQFHIQPGDFVICDQFVDRTKGREDTYYDGNEVKHISAAEPYNRELREIAIQCGRNLGIKIHESGTIVVIQGPRFSTRAESKWFNQMGWDVVNMTQYPEAYLALELEIPYVNISLVTDYDAGVEGREDIPAVTEGEVYMVFKENIDKVKSLLFEMIKNIT